MEAYSRKNDQFFSLFMFAIMKRSGIKRSANGTYQRLNENHYERIGKIPKICFPNNKILTTVAHACTLTPGPTPIIREQYRIPVQITPRIG